MKQAFRSHIKSNIKIKSELRGLESTVNSGFCRELTSCFGFPLILQGVSPSDRRKRRESIPQCSKAVNSLFKAEWSALPSSVYHQMGTVWDGPHS